MSQIIEVKVPDIGDFHDVPVIELLVEPGATVQAEDPLLTLESDKATIDVPSPVGGVLKEFTVKVGDKISEGSLIARIEGAATAGAAAPAEKAAPVAQAAAPAAPISVPTVSPAPAPAPAPIQTSPTPVSASALNVPANQPLEWASAPVGIPTAIPPTPSKTTHASPSVRSLARELGIDLTQVTANGPKGRILREDLIAFVKGTLQARPATGAAGVVGGSGGAGLDLLPWPKIDFAKFGEIEIQPLSRIKKISGQNLARNWVMIPAVTYHDEADITDLEAFRLALNKENEKGGGAKITMLAFIVKACQLALKKFPEFNASLDGDTLVLKKYFNIAFAADTPNGLVVPVIKGVDRMTVSEIAAECGALAKKARDGKLAPADMQGACFTVSSLGGIGGISFSPIVNAPEVAILGVSRSLMKPVWNGTAFAPRLTLPLALSADHRVIDGALGTRFNAYVAQLLSDMRRALV